MRRNGGWISLVAALSWSALGYGQEDADLARAQSRFQEALTDERAGAWEKAIAEFTEAGALAHKETPQLLYHLGLCHAKIGKLVLAQGELLRAAEQATTEHLDNVAKTSKAELAEVQPRIASLALTRPARGDVTAVMVDGVDVTPKLGTGIDLDPGVHRVVVTYADGPPMDLRETLGDGEKRALAIPEPAVVAAPPSPPEPVPPPPEVPAPRPALPAAAVEPSKVPVRTLGWILLGGGAALVAGGAASWAMRDGAVST